MEITKYCVKIVIGKGYHVDTVVYYRNKLPMPILEKYRWYFEYLAALIKVSCPKSKVEIAIAPQTLLQGTEYVEQKTKTLLIAKRARLKKLENIKVVANLFQLEEQENESKKIKLRNDIKDLEEGRFNYYIPPTYINKIKDYIHGKIRI